MIRTVIAIVDDMFFVSKIRATGKALGMIVKFPRTTEAFRATISDEPPELVIVDLHNEKVNPFELAAELKSYRTPTAVPLLGFFSHVQADVQRKAKQAGYDEIIPRSVFARDLAKILAGDWKSPDRAETET
jgi:PleD family two-component response regulator